MGFFSSAWKAVKKAVKQVSRPISTIASALGVGRSGGDSENVEINQQFAPPINSPDGWGDSPEVGNDTEGHARKKKGKARLKITTNGDDSRASSGSGLNI